MWPAFVIVLCGIVSLFSSVGAEYITIRSRFSTNYSIRVKEFADEELCHGGGKHYAGWADVADRHLFYWYHSARHNDNEDAPWLVWLQGGPGGSSVVGMLLENGPCIMEEDMNSTRFNPHSWTESYNVIYLDQPAGVGYSYIDDPDNLEKYPRRSEESAIDFIAVIKLFQEAFPELTSIPLHIAGESFAGRYVPEYAAAIIEYNARVPSTSKIPLASVMIGNGFTSIHEQYPALYYTGCYTHHGISPIFNESQCDSMAAAVDRCESLAERCVDLPDELVCNAAGKYCKEHLQDVIKTTLVNQYDRTVTCPALGQCYPLIDHIGKWMNSEDVREKLEIEGQTKGKAGVFQIENGIINKRYIESADYYTSSIPALQKVLNAPGIPVLYYVGVQDWICNPLGVEALLDNTRWKNHAKFRGATPAALPWETRNGGAAGTLRKVDGLWYVEMNSAGHLVPYDQPRSSLLLVQTWLRDVEAKYVKAKLDSPRGQQKLQRIYHWKEPESYEDL